MRLKTRSKYRAVPTVVDGIRFASKREAQRYWELKMLERTGKIFRLKLQPRFRLCAWNTKALENEALPALGNYVADFAYCNHQGCLCVNGCTVEDAKGFKTPLYRWKKKHVESQYGIVICEV